MVDFKDDAISTLGRTAFAARFGGIYEHSAWIAEHTYDQNRLPGSYFKRVVQLWLKI